MNPTCHIEMTSQTHRTQIKSGVLSTDRNLDDLTLSSPGPSTHLAPSSTGSVSGYAFSQEVEVYDQVSTGLDKVGGESRATVHMRKILSAVGGFSQSLFRLMRWKSKYGSFTFSVRVWYLLGCVAALLTTICERYHEEVILRGLASRGDESSTDRRCRRVKFLFDQVKLTDDEIRESCQRCAEPSIFEGSLQGQVPIDRQLLVQIDRQIPKGQLTPQERNRRLVDTYYDLCSKRTDKEAALAHIIGQAEFDQIKTLCFADSLIEASYQPPVGVVSAQSDPQIQDLAIVETLANDPLARIDQEIVKVELKIVNRRRALLVMIGVVAVFSALLIASGGSLLVLTCVIATVYSLGTLGRSCYNLVQDYRMGKISGRKATYILVVALLLTAVTTLATCLTGGVAPLLILAVVGLGSTIYQGVRYLQRWQASRQIDSPQRRARAQLLRAFAGIRPDQQVGLRDLEQQSQV